MLIQKTLRWFALLVFTQGFFLGCRSTAPVGADSHLENFGFGLGGDFDDAKSSFYEVYVPRKVTSVADGSTFMDGKVRLHRGRGAFGPRFGDAKSLTLKIDNAADKNQLSIAKLCLKSASKALQMNYISGREGTMFMRVLLRDNAPLTPAANGAAVISASSVLRCSALYVQDVQDNQ